MIIDAHTHIAGFDDHDYTPEEIVDSMQVAGIDYSILIANGRTGRETGLTTEQAIETSKNHPQLKPIGCVDWGKIGEEQINQLTNYLGSGQIHGVKLYAGYDNYYWWDEKLDPLYKYCEQNSHAVAFHTGALAAGDTGLLKQSHPLEADQVANKFPSLKIVLCHAGNPWIMDAAVVVAKNPNIYVDLSGYFAEFTRIDPIEVEQYKRVMGDFKTFVGDYKKCLFGTDYPLYNQKEYLDAVRTLEMTDDEKELVFWKNANEVYNLDL